LGWIQCHWSRKSCITSSHCIILHNKLSIYFFSAQGRYTEGFSFASFQCFADYHYTSSGFGAKGGIEIWDGASATGAVKVVSSAATVPFYILSSQFYFFSAQGRYTERFSFAYFQYFADYNYTSSGFGAKDGIEIWDGSSVTGAVKVVSSAATVSFYMISSQAYFFLAQVRYTERFSFASFQYFADYRTDGNTLHSNNKSNIIYNCYCYNCYLH
jgi:hypothetical protein